MKDLNQISSDLRGKGMKMTRQRKLILEVLRSTKTHPTAEWIYQQVRRDLPSVSLGTIYRNLNTLREEGLLLELNYGKHQSRYDATTSPHYHVRCTHCGIVRDVPLASLSGVDEQVETLTGFAVGNHRLEFNGICPDCIRPD